MSRPVFSLFAASLSRSPSLFLFFSELVMGSIEQQMEDRKEKIKEKAQNARKQRILSPLPPRWKWVPKAVVLKDLQNSALERDWVRETTFWIKCACRRLSRVTPMSFVETSILVRNVEGQKTREYYRYEIWKLSSSNSIPYSYSDFYSPTTLKKSTVYTLTLDRKGPVWGRCFAIAVGLSISDTHSSLPSFFFFK